MEFDIQAMVNGALAKSKKTVSSLKDLETALKEVYSTAEAEYKAQKEKREAEEAQKQQKINAVADALAENVNELFNLMWPDCSNQTPITGEQVIEALNDIKEMIESLSKVNKTTTQDMIAKSRHNAQDKDEEDIFDFLADLFG